MHFFYLNQEPEMGGYSKLLTTMSKNYKENKAYPFPLLVLSTTMHIDYEQEHKFK